ncbi:MAG: hypothetical protein L7F77_06850 [Candidatus Magnetominusculus sp. LBB02]|nr:hypothetical protein [Candidatus Magnetominusculus sp. LBB02]
MPIRRKNYFTSSYYKKILGYWQSWQRGVFNAFGNIRVLTVTTSNKRINSMIGACKDVDARKKGSRMFLFARATDFDIKNTVRTLERIWYNARDNDMVSLID